MSGDRDPAGRDREEDSGSSPGEKGPPAWRSRDGGETEETGNEPMADEPPDSSSEVQQVGGLSLSDDEPGADEDPS